MGDAESRVNSWSMLIVNDNNRGAGSGHSKVIRTSSGGVSIVKIGGKQSRGQIRIAGYKEMTASDRYALRSGTRFVLVPDKERARQKIDSYSYLIR